MYGSSFSNPDNSQISILRSTPAKAPVTQEESCLRFKSLFPKKRLFQDDKQVVN